MRAFEGQHSDSQPIKRSQAQKQAQLSLLREQLAGLKSHAASGLRDGIIRRIAELERDLGQDTQAAERQNRTGGRR